MKSYDAVVIGGGPAGLTAALYLLRSGVKTLLVERLAPGGQVLMTAEIENYPGFPAGLQGFELADKFDAHLADYPLERITDEILDIEIGSQSHKINVGNEWIKAGAIIIASGAQYRPLGVRGEAENIGRGVSYCAMCDGNFYRNKTVAVVGGGNSALEESLYLAKLVDNLYLIHRREEFRGLQCYQDKCFAHPAITVLRSRKIDSINNDQNGVNSISLSHVTDETKKEEIKVDGVFVFVGFNPNMKFIPQDIAADSNGIITDIEMRTNIPGIFAAGDVRSKACRQVATAVGDGATAANSAFSYLEQKNA